MLASACDPGKFDDRPELPDTNLDASVGLDASLDHDSASLDGGLDRQAVDARLTEPDGGALASPDAGLGGTGLSDAGVCIAPRGTAILPLVIVPNSLRELAFVSNPSGVSGRFARAIKPQGSKLLWALMTTPPAISAADGGVSQPESYATVARSSLVGPWSSDGVLPGAPTEIVLEERVGGNALPAPLVTPLLQPVVGSQLSTIGLVVVDGVASVYLKQFYIFASVSTYLGTLGPSDYVLHDKPAPLFSASMSQPLFGTGAFARMDQVYSFGCQYAVGPPAGYPCFMSRASDQTLDDPTKYRVYGAAGSAKPDYTAALDQGTPMFQGAEALSLSFNKHLGLWLAVTSGGGSDLDEGSALIRSAPQPEGPWSEPQVVPMPQTAQGLKAHYVLEHPDLSPNCGQRLVLSYLEPATKVPIGRIIPGRIKLVTLDLQ